MAYWLQVQSMSERDRRRFDASLVRVNDASAGPASALPPGAALLAGMMAKGAM